MTETLIHPPRTIMEVFKMLPEGTLAEVIENSLYMSPTPKSIHQRVSRDPTNSLINKLKESTLGEIFTAPFDVYLDEEANAVQPDIFFVATSNLYIVEDDGYVHGVPDLVIQILSKGNESMIA